MDETGHYKFSATLSNTVCSQSNTHPCWLTHTVTHSHKSITKTRQYFIRSFEGKFVAVASPGSLPDVHQQQLRQTHDPEGAARCQELWALPTQQRPGCFPQQVCRHSAGAAAGLGDQDWPPGQGGSHVWSGPLLDLLLAWKCLCSYEQNTDWHKLTSRSAVY